MSASAAVCAGSRDGAVAATLMHREAAAAAVVVQEQLARDAAALAQLGAALRELAPRAVVTCARGSSDHAATYAKYLVETRARVLTASAAPSVSSIYGIDQDLRQCLFLAISQSGRSPDLLASAARARDCGARVLALCNVEDSPLMQLADWRVPLRAGPELSVAATKSFLATLAAIARVVAAWTGSEALAHAIAGLPGLMRQAWACDWSAAAPQLAQAEHLYVVGRGLGLAAAQEIALKFKETCGLHAEAFSSAELRHGPYALLGPRFPALLLAQDDGTRAGLAALAADLAALGAPVLLAGARVPGVVQLPAVAAAPELAPILQVQSAYRLVAGLALQRGHDPDRPSHLRKVTETL